MASSAFMNVFPTLGLFWEGPRRFWSRDILYDHRVLLDAAFFLLLYSIYDIMVTRLPGNLITLYPGHLISWSAGNFGWLDLLAAPPVDLDLTTIFAAGKAAKCPIKGDPHTHPSTIS